MGARGRGVVSRRSACVVAAAAAVVTTTATPPVARGAAPDAVATASPSTFDTKCLDEVAIPGAYTNPCQKQRFRQLDFPNVGGLSIEQGDVGPGTTGAAVWNAGTALAGYLATNPEVAKGRRVIELGCGTGLCGIVAAKQGAAQVVLTDGNSELLGRVQRNVEGNLAPSMARNVEVRALKWGDLIDDRLLSSFDVVLGSDVLYNSAGWRAFAASAKELLRPGGTILLAESGHETTRVESTLGGFRVVAEGCGLVVEDAESLPYGECQLVAARLRP